MATALAKAKKKLRSRPILGTIRRVVIPETGELVGAWVPMHPVDQKSMRENRYTVGKELRAVFKQARNVGWWRKTHLLGGWLAQHVDGFEALSQHAAIKRLQELSGVGCEQVVYDIPNLGQLTRSEALSLNFDDCDEGEFNTLWTGWIEWLRLEKWGALDPLSREEVEELIRNPHEAA